MAKTEKNSSPKSHAGAIVAGIAGLTAAAVGAYYLYGSKNAPKNRAQVKSWMLKAKGEVLEKLEGVQDVTESAYATAIDAVAKKYKAIKEIDAVELEAFINDMKAHWSGIKKSSGKKGAKKPAAKKVAKKASK